MYLFFVKIFSDNLDVSKGCWNAQNIDSKTLKEQNVKCFFKNKSDKSFLINIYDICDRNIDIKIW